MSSDITGIVGSGGAVAFVVGLHARSGWIASLMLLDRSEAERQNLKAAIMTCEDGDPRWSPFDGFPDGLNAFGLDQETAVSRLIVKLEALKPRKSKGKTCSRNT